MGVKRVRRQNNDGTKIVRPAGRDPKIHSLPRRAPSPAAAPQIRAFSRDGPDGTEKKTKKLRKSSCGFSAIRIDHGHRRGGHLTRIRERAISSVGRAPRLHRGCREFESLIAHHFSNLKLLKCLRCGACRRRCRHGFGPKIGSGPDCRSDVDVRTAQSGNVVAAKIMRSENFGIYSCPPAKIRERFFSSLKTFYVKDVNFGEYQAVYSFLSGNRLDTATTLHRVILFVNCSVRGARIQLFEKLAGRRANAVQQCNFGNR